MRMEPKPAAIHGHGESHTHLQPSWHLEVRRPVHRSAHAVPVAVSLVPRVVHMLHMEQHHAQCATKPASEEQQLEHERAAVRVHKVVVTVHEDRVDNLVPGAVGACTALASVEGNAELHPPQTKWGHDEEDRWKAEDTPQSALPHGHGQELLRGVEHRLSPVILVLVHVAHVVVMQVMGRTKVGGCPREDGEQVAARHIRKLGPTKEGSVATIVQNQERTHGGQSPESAQSDQHKNVWTGCLTVLVSCVMPASNEAQANHRVQHRAPVLRREVLHVCHVDRLLVQARRSTWTQVPRLRHILCTLSRRHGEPQASRAKADGSCVSTSTSRTTFESIHVGLHVMRPGFYMCIY